MLGKLGLKRRALLGGGAGIIIGGKGAAKAALEQMGYGMPFGGPVGPPIGGFGGPLENSWAQGGAEMALSGETRMKVSKLLQHYFRSGNIKHHDLKACHSTQRWWMAYRQRERERKDQERAIAFVCGRLGFEPGGIGELGVRKVAKDFGMLSWEEDYDE